MQNVSGGIGAKGNTSTKLGNKHTGNLHSVNSDLGTFAWILHRTDIMQILLLDNSTNLIAIRELHLVLFTATSTSTNSFS